MVKIFLFIVGLAHFGLPAEAQNESLSGNVSATLLFMDWPTDSAFEKSCDICGRDFVFIPI